MPPRYVLFDLDQTLVDRQTATRVLAGQLFDSDALHRTSLDRNVAIDDFLRLDNNGYEPDKLRLFTELEKVWGGLKHTPAELAEWLRSTPRTWYSPDPEVRALLDNLSAKDLTWGIVTNGPPTQNDKAQRIGVLEGSSCFIISEEVGVAKPDPVIFNIALRELGAPDPKTVLFVGDNPIADIAGAKAVGMETAWVRNGSSWPIEISQPDHTFDSVLECTQLFD
jgi:HAD superfamily hydrolase (TIGR01509 family)